MRSKFGPSPNIDEFSTETFVHYFDIFSNGHHTGTLFLHRQLWLDEKRFPALTQNEVTSKMRAHLAGGNLNE